MLYSLARLHVPPQKKKHLTILEHSPAQPCQEMDLKTEPKKPMVYHNVPCNCSHLRGYTMVCLISRHTQENVEISIGHRRRGAPSKGLGHAFAQARDAPVAMRSVQQKRLFRWPMGCLLTDE